VPNLTIGPMVCKALRDHGVTKDIDVHLMVQPVDAMIQDFAKAGASYITFHPEASNHVDRSLQLIRSSGCKSGLVLTPSTSLDYCKYVMDKIDIILLMSVNPGFGGQSFIPSTLKVLNNTSIKLVLLVVKLERYALHSQYCRPTQYPSLFLAHILTLDSSLFNLLPVSVPVPWMCIETQGGQKDD
jgi:ribulose-phosphate 3-epimerase